MNLGESIRMNHVLIRVTSDPWPECEKPDFVIRACIGLSLTATLKIPPGGTPYPQGVYLVPLTDVMKKIESVSTDTYNWLKNFWRWDWVNETVEGQGFLSPLIPFPFDSCFECHTEVVQ